MREEEKGSCKRAFCGREMEERGVDGCVDVGDGVWDGAIKKKRIKRDSRQEKRY